METAENKNEKKKNKPSKFKFVHISRKLSRRDIAMQLWREKVLEKIATRFFCWIIGRSRLDSPSRPWSRRRLRSTGWTGGRTTWSISPSVVWHSLERWRRAAAAEATRSATWTCCRWFLPRTNKNRSINKKKKMSLFKFQTFSRLAVAWQVQINTAETKAYCSNWEDPLQTTDTELLWISGKCNKSPMAWKKIFYLAHLDGFA